MKTTGIFSVLAISSVLLATFYFSSWRVNQDNSAVGNDSKIAGELEGNPEIRRLPLNPPPIRPEFHEPLEREQVQVTEQLIEKVKLREKEINRMMVTYDQVRSDSELRASQRGELERALTQYSEDIKPIVLATIEQSKQQN